MINQKITVYSLAVILALVGIVYGLVAYSEYEDFKELSDMGIKGETSEKQIETSFFSATGIINFVLSAGVLKSGLRKMTPYIVSIIASIALIAIYISSRTVGVPIVGVEYYIGRLDIVSKVLQVVAIALSCISIYSLRNSKIIRVT
jgi:hypothetical protein